MKRIFSLALAGLAVLTFSGCSSGGDSGGSGSSLTKITTGGSISVYDSTIEIYNHETSANDICEVYSVPDNSSNWGVDLLGTGHIAPANVRQFGSDHCDQYWAIKIVDCAGNESEGAYYRECYTTTYFTFKNW